MYSNNKTKIQENRILRLQKCNHMNVRNYILTISTIVVTLYSCKKDDDGGGATVVPIRDRGEQQVKDDAKLKDYLKTHFYTRVDNTSENPKFKITHFDTIVGVNSSQTSIMDSGKLQSKTITYGDVKYTYYVLSFNEGANEKRKPTFADSTLVTYRGELLYDNKDSDGDGIPDKADVDADGDKTNDIVNNVVRSDKDNDQIADDSDADDDGVAGTDSGKIDSDEDGIIDANDPVDNNDLDRRVFDSAITPVWFDLLNTVKGFREGMLGYKGASAGQFNPDKGTVDYGNDFGDFVIFIPSGLGYFASVQGSIPAYSPLIFSIQLYDSNESDHDHDGIPSYLEDLNGDGNLLNDNTSGTNVPNYMNNDDDSDRRLTKDEITVKDLNNDGKISLDEITFYDDNGNGIKNHLDPQDKDKKNG